MAYLTCSTKTSLVAIIFLLSLSLEVHAQAILNGDFENSNHGWQACLNKHGQEAMYGGISLSNSVMVIDGHIDRTSTNDDRIVCQTIHNFSIGHHYTLSFNAANVSNCTSRINPRAFIVDVDQGALNQRVVVGSSSGFYSFLLSFVATQSTHVLSFYPDFNDPCGVMLDNLRFIIVVPIELNFFAAKLDKQNVVIRWETASEYNSDYFVVERSVNGFEWEDIGRIDAVGNSKNSQNYEMLDRNFFNAVSYYRLKEVSLGREVSYSDVQVVTKKESAAQTTIYPNPAQNKLYIEIESTKEKNPLVFNSLGQKILIDYKQNARGIVLNTSTLIDGIYFLHLSTDNTSQLRQFVVQH